MTAAADPATTEQAPAPEVRQCLDREAPEFGYTAVAGVGLMAGRWMVATPENGGHWGEDAEVANWTPLAAPAPAKAAPAQQTAAAK